MKQRPTESVKTTVESFWYERVLPSLRERYFNENVWRRPSSKRVFELAENLFKLSRIPFLRERLPQFDPKKSNISWIPINEKIEGAEDITLPLDIVDRFIEKAKHRVIVNYCGCRVTLGCSHYPQDIGCLMMGESALHIPERIRREVTIEEAKDHVRKAVKAGLVPMTGKARLDNDIFMIPDEGKLLTVCLCCECCCISRFLRSMPQDVVAGFQHPVEGLTVEVTDECVGCGDCVSTCYIDAIEVQNGRAVIGGKCQVCGRCATTCQQEAIKLKLDNPNAVDDVVRRIESVVDF